MKKFIVDLYSEDAHEPIGSFGVDDFSEMKEGIHHVEEMTGRITDFVLVIDEQTAKREWFILDESVALHSADEELSEALDSEYGEEDILETEEMGWFEELLFEEVMDLDETRRRRVNSKGKVVRIRSREIRRRTAQKTTGMTRSALKRRARKAARSRRRNPGGQRRALRKRRRAMRKRKQMGIKSGS